MSLLLQTSLVCLLWQLADAVTFHVPSQPPGNASEHIIPSPVGVSIEFYQFPEYTENLPSTKQCLQNLKDLGGSWPPLRIGGTSQDFATYNPSLSEEITYKERGTQLPADIQFGPSFMKLAGTYPGSTTLGLNRRSNDIQNTIAAAIVAVNDMKNLRAIELANEPNFFDAKAPINTNGGQWTDADDYASQASWQKSVGNALNKRNIISAGVFWGTRFNIRGLAAKEGDSISYVKDFCSHNYPQGPNNMNLARLMDHSDIHANVLHYKPEIDAAQAKGKQFVMGETNSATQGGGGVSASYGAALWIIDYTMNLLWQGTRAVYFHQATIGRYESLPPYNWWGRHWVTAPYYGAYMVSLALAGADQIAPLDTFSDHYGAWVIYSHGKATKVLLYYSDYYASGTRSFQTFTLTGLSGNSKRSVRLTAPLSTTKHLGPTIGGQTFHDGTCKISGDLKNGHHPVRGGKASFVVRASEAMLVYL